MPFIQKSRLININYNDNQRTIYNQIFDYGKGDNTLFAMDNGLGKTVLIQFMMQPFVKNKRDLAGRSFYNYFTTGNASYVLHELQVENERSLLVGMVIKKDVKEDVTNKLKIIAFINQYTEPNEYDLIHIPFVDKGRILKFSEAETLIKNISKDKSSFLYFNFNDYEKRQQYFEILESFNINYKEWEDIIRKTNDDESGLSKLYDKNKDDEALIKNEIIPLIESKIATTDKKINVIRNNLKRYIQSFKKSKEGVYRLKIYQSFQFEFEPLIVKVKEGVNQKEKAKCFKNKLKNIFFFTINYQDELRNSLEESVLNQEKLLHDLKQIDYEKVSLNYYEKENEIANINQDKNKLLQEIIDAESEVTSLSKEKAILQALKKYENLKTIQNQLTTVLEGINNSKRTDEEAKAAIKNYSYSLKVLYRECLINLKDSLDTFRKNYKTINEKLKCTKDDQISKNQELTKSNNLLSRLYYQIENFQKLSNDFKIDSKTDLKNYLASIDEDINKTNTDLLVLANKVAENQSKNKKIQAKLEELTKDLLQAKEELTQVNVYYRRYQQETSDLETIFLQKGFEEATDLSLLINKINNEIDSLEAEKRNLLKRIDANLNILSNYQTGTITISQTIIDTLSEKGILFDYGLKYLQKRTKEEQQLLHQNNPFFPYSIILKKQDLEILQKEKIDVFTQTVIPIIQIDNSELTLTANNQIVKVDNQQFLIHFNQELLNQESRAKLINKIKAENARYEKEIIRCDASIIRNYEYLQKATNYQEADEKDYQLKIKKSQTKISEIEENIDLNRKSLKEIESNNIHKDIIQKNSQLQQLLTLKSNTELFIKSYYNYLESLAVKEKEELNNKKIIDNLNKLETTLESLRNESKDHELKIMQLNEEIKNIEKRALSYEEAEEGELISESIDVLESKLKSLHNKYDLHLSMLHFQKEDLTNRLENTKNELKALESKSDLKESDYLNKRFYEEDYQAILNILDNLENKKSELNAQIAQINVLLAVAKKDHEYILKDLNKLGYLYPLENSEIGKNNFNERIKVIKEAVKENEAAMNSKNKEMNELDLIKKLLEPLVDLGKDQMEAGFCYSFNDLTKVGEEIRILKKDYEEITKANLATDEELSKEMRILYEKYRDLDHVLKDQMRVYTLKKSLIDASGELLIFESYLANTIKRIKLSVKHLHEEETIIHNEVLRYCSEVLEELKSIDAKSSITINKKTQKLMIIELPKSVNEAAVKEFISKKVFEYSADEEFEKLLNFEISTEELMNKYLGGIQHLKVIIKKIEQKRLIPKTWKETLSENSGGEKFVSMFILLACFLSYMRKDKIGIGLMEDKKIMIMDNPFAKTNAEHLLKPLFDIASKYNIQLICFSGIGGSAVYNQFDRIYSAKAISNSNNKEQVAFTLDKAPTNDTLEFSEFTFYQP